YTSGSTGRPKGEEVNHRANVNRLFCMQHEYALDAQDVDLQKTPCSFDVSVCEYLCPLMVGALLVMAPP
ncbi:AMP-binding protein, partial [Serratia bockelmannii]|uniref:AMP-binding protein n=1 Tax=Serratia bockelmannii TaxID=2703793 RepID=UPI003CFA2A88